MPLPAAAVPRTRIHTRRILLEGWRRDDGLWDIEAYLTDLLNSLPTAAIQTFASEMSDTVGRTPGAKPFQLDQCHALATTSETVRRYYPRWFRGNKTGTWSQKSMSAPDQRSTYNKEDA